MSKRTPPPEAAEPGPAKVARTEGPPANGVAQAAAGVLEAITDFKPPPKDIPTLHYKEGRLARDFISYFRNGKTSLLVAIAPEYMVGSNKQVKSRQLWGEDVYTDDSDLVAVLLHLGYYASNNVAHHPLVARFYAQVTLLPPRERYASCFRNAVRSRGWFSKIDGCSFQVDRCWLVTRSNKQLELQQRVDDSTIHPTFALSNNDRQISTRSATGSSRNKPVTEVTVLYNLVNEPWLKYAMSAVADRGLKSSHWTASRLREEALYLETARERFELSFAGAAGDDAAADTYTFARCKRILPGVEQKKLGCPLPAEEVDVIEADLAWDDVQWANMSMSVRGKQYKMLRLHFLPRGKPV